jgi:transketolase
MAESLTEDRLLPDATNNDMPNAIRALAMDAAKAESGHPGLPMAWPTHC